LLSRTKRRSHAVFWMQDHDTRCVHQLSDLTNARLSRPRVAYTEVGKVKSANNLCPVIDLVHSYTYHARRSTAPVPAGGAGGSAMG
jgi:hypothetical protein